MANPLSKAEAQRRVAAVDAALRKGHRARGSTGAGPAAMNVAAQACKISRVTFYDSIKRAKEIYGLEPDWSLAKGPPPAAEIPDAMALENQRLKDEAVRLRSQLVAARREVISEQIVLDKILKISEQAVRSPVPDWATRIPRNAKHVAGVPCLLWSDWHWSERVRPEEVDGVNAFDLDIARRRAKHLLATTINLALNHMTGATYPGCVLNLGGDLISGAIHDELAESDEATAQQCVAELVGVLTGMIRELKRAFGAVYVACVAGNHGRGPNAHRRFKGRAYNSFEWLLYRLLAAGFAEDDKVTFSVTAGTDVGYSIYGHRYLLTHGDTLGVKGGDGIIGALGPIMRGNVKVSNQRTAIGLPFDTLLMGHWHQYLFLRWLIVNGSLKGYDEFAKLAIRARLEPPQQALWFTHPQYGITCDWNVYCEPEPYGKRSGKWVEAA